MNETVQAVLDFVKLLFIVFLIIHWTSCIFFAIALEEVNSDQSRITWIDVFFKD